MLSKGLLNRIREALESARSGANAEVERQAELELSSALQIVDPIQRFEALRKIQNKYAPVDYG